MSGAWLWRIGAVILLGAMAAENGFATHRSPAVEKYHETIRTAAEKIPSRLGPWVGEDIPVQAQAVTVLKPNVMISRQYLNIDTGETAGLLLVHCADAHHMVGHFPMRCYPAEGWTVAGSFEKDWTVDGQKFTGTEYHFTKVEEGASGHSAEHSIVVVNCLMRPDGAVLRDMAAMSKTILGAGGQASGAGQIQIIFDAGVPVAKRDAAVVALSRGCLPVIRSILAKAPA